MAAVWTASLAAVAASLSIQGAAAGTTNLTVYRITPRNYTGVADLDTGDSAGDAFFGLYEMSAPVVCNESTSTQGASGLLCSNEPILQIPGFNVYIKVIVEVDDRFGDYSECNPSHDAPHDFICEHQWDGQCWGEYCASCLKSRSCSMFYVLWLRALTELTEFAPCALL